MNKEAIISLWQEAFGDTKEEIEFFIDNVNNAECLNISDGDELLAMLYFVECYINGREGRYIYAACTAERHRNEGLMTALLHNAEKHCSNYICLIPATESLADFYIKRGFTEKADISELQFFQSDEIKEYLLEGFSLQHPVILIKELEG